MKLKQISVFLENRPGHLLSICDLLAQHHIDIATLTLADTSEFGLLRIIVKDWKKAQEVLEAKGCAINITEVMAIEVPDTAGGLAEVLKIAQAGGLNVEYMYAFTSCNSQNAQIVFRFKNMENASDVLTNAGISVLSAVNFYN